MSPHCDTILINRNSGAALSKEEREQGRIWVEEEIRRLAREREVQLVEPIEWNADFDRSVYWVRITTVAGDNKLWKFSYEQLEDSVSDKRVRRELERAIAFVVPDRSNQNTFSETGSASEESRQSTVDPHRSDMAAVEPKRLLRVFLCHSKIDKQAVRVLYRKLVADGIDPWFDEEDLLPGQEWEAVIKKAVQNSDVVLVCLSRASVERRGFAQKEIKFALDVADEQPEGTIYLIPLKLEECEIPDRLKKWHWVELFQPNGYQKLLSALRERLPTSPERRSMGEAELRKLVESVDLSITAQHGNNCDFTIEVENHSEVDVEIKSIVLWSGDTRVCKPAFPRDGFRWQVPAKRNIPIQLTANEDIVLKLARIYEQPPSVGNFPRTFRADITVELRCEIRGVGRVFKETSTVKVDYGNRQITRM